MKQSFQIKSENLCFKILFLGSSSVDNTSLIKQFLKNKFAMNSMSTVGVACLIILMLILQGVQNSYNKYQQVKVQMWDTAEQERFRSITKTYY